VASCEPPNFTSISYLNASFAQTTAKADREIKHVHLLSQSENNLLSKVQFPIPQSTEFPTSCSRQLQAEQRLSD
jgi:hypothetical protein